MKTAEQLGRGLGQLLEYFSYPKEKPNVGEFSAGWFKEDNAEVLAKFLSETTDIVVELGSWTGGSARFISDTAPNAKVLAVDHWLGSYEHVLVDKWRKQIPTLYDSFIANCWDYRDKIIPVRADSVTGLRVIHSCGIEPDLIYIDGSHDYASVYRDLTIASKFFPSACIVGDDWSWPGVKMAVTEHIANEMKRWNDITVEQIGDCWWLNQHGKIPKRPQSAN